MNMREVVQLFQAMSDPTRQKILILLEGREMCVNDLVAEFGVSQPTISKHLAVLRNAGLVTSRRDRQQVFYSLNCRCMRNRCTEFFKNFECCSDLFKQQTLDVEV